MNGKLSFLCIGSPDLSCGVVFSAKEVTWISKYTKKILGDRKSLVSGTLRRTIPRLKLASSSIIYGNTWFPKNGREQNVSWSFPRSLSIYSGCFSQLQGGVWESDPRITSLCRCRGMLSWLPVYLRFKSSHRPTIVTWARWMHKWKPR